jgi:hypothetical protein
VRVDSWAGGDGARAGVSLYNDPATGKGYNLLFHNNTSTVQFLDDGVAWGNSYTFSWSVGTWYWFKLAMINGTLYGKVWQDGTSEPANWMFTQSGWTDRTGGAPGLNGGSSISGTSATVSFANFSAAAVYSYDANGNRTMTGYQTGSGNQVTTDGLWSYTYDAEGNQT